MIGDISSRPGLFTGLSGRLLLLTALFVMLAEALILLPSMARFRESYLHEQMAKAYLAVLAVEATPNKELDESLGRLLLAHAGVRGVILDAPNRRRMIMTEAPLRAVGATLVVGADESFASMIVDSVRTVLRGEDRLLRIVGAAPGESNAKIEVLLDEAPLRRAMRAYAGRVLALSLAISLIAASLVYLTLQIVLVRPVRRITDQVGRFRLNPEAGIAQSGANFRRNDEIGVLQRAVSQMQRDIRAALRQKTRLAALGAAVAKISHDLRNTLSTAVLLSDRLSASDDPETRRLSPRLVRTIDQAATMCARSLAYLRDEQPPLVEQWVSLRQILDDALVQARNLPSAAEELDIEYQEEFRDKTLFADGDQLLRVLGNLFFNAAEAGATRLVVRDDAVADRLAVDIADNGRGIAPDVQERLFQPFAAGRRGGTGLGLVIAREIMQSHGGDLLLLSTGSSGTTFRLTLPLSRLCASAKTKSRSASHH